LSKRIYIAHSLQLRDWVAEEIIPKIEGMKTVKMGTAEQYREEPFFDCVNPFKDRLDLFKGKTNEEIRANRKWVQPKLVVQHDLNDIFTCDGMLVINTEGPSYGSAYEASIFFHRTNGLGMIIYLVNEKYEHHPWLNHFSHAVVTDIDDAMRALEMFYNVKRD